jgi:hypothetical protein
LVLEEIELIGISFCNLKDWFGRAFDEVRSKDQFCKYEGSISASDTNVKDPDGARGLGSDIT